MADPTVDEPPGVIIREVTAEDVIEWLNEHLAIYARECLDLRQQLAERDRKIAMLLRFEADFARQRGEA